VQGLLERLDVAYVGAGVAASALAMDKDLFKKVMRDSGIPVARHHTIRLGDPVENPFGYPVFVKPARLGSSVGISKVRDESSLAEAVALARRHDEKVLVEEFVEGLEVEVGVLGNRVPPPIASLPGAIDTLGHDWYDYASKYDADGMNLIVPPDLERETIELVQRRAVDAFIASECEGLARVDFFVRASDGEVVVNELNTMPGFTATSVYARLFEASGIGYGELLDRLIRLALERRERRSTLEY
jgi:D-alanine-D-alanine ligase